MSNGKPKKKVATRKKAISICAPCNAVTKKKWLKWSNEPMKMAIQDGWFRIKEATREYGVLRTTLQDCISRRVVHGIKRRPKP